MLVSSQYSAYIPYTHSHILCLHQRMCCSSWIYILANYYCDQTASRARSFVVARKSVTRLHASTASERCTVKTGKHWSPAHVQMAGSLAVGLDCFWPGEFIFHLRHTHKIRQNCESGLRAVAAAFSQISFIATRPTQTQLQSQSQSMFLDFCCCCGGGFVPWCWNHYRRTIANTVDALTQSSLWLQLLLMNCERDPLVCP